MGSPARSTRNRSTTIPTRSPTPWKWAGIHALFITAAGAAGLVAWKLNEQHRETTEEALRLARESERSRAEAAQLARLGSFEFDPATGEVQWSAELYEIFGLDPRTTEPSYERYMSVVHPHDRGRVGAVVQHALETGEHFSHQYRAVLDDGSLRVFHARGEVATPPNGRRMLLGTCQDITDRARVESESRQRAKEQRAVATLGDRALAGGAPEELMREAATMVADVVGVDIAAVMIRADDAEGGLIFRGAAGLPAHVLDFRIPGGTRSQAGYTLDHGGPVIVSDWNEEERFERPPSLAEVDARSGVTVTIRGSDEVHGVLGMQSITPRTFSIEEVNFLQSVAHVLAAAIERSGTELEMRHQALHDPLTGLPNRNLFTDRLAHALELARRHGTQVAVLFGDLDQFKLVNDSLGARGRRRAPARGRAADRRRPPRRRHGRAVRGRRVRDPGRGGRIRARRDPGRRTDPGGARGAVRPPRPRPLRDGHAGDRDRNRRGRARGADPRLGRRDVPRQGARARHLRALRRGDAGARARPPSHRERHAARARARRVRGPLPAGHRARDRCGSRASRRCCAGTTRSAACWGRTRSSGSPRRAG